MIADGTMNPLAFKPSTSDLTDYHGRKYQYSLTTMIFNDDKLRIRYYLAGHPGCTHNNPVMTNTSIAKQPDKNFNANQYVIADSAMSPSWWMVPSFKKPHNSSLPQNKEIFHKMLARARILSEHTIGLWKGWFPWLQSIRMVVTEKVESMNLYPVGVLCTIAERISR